MENKSERIFREYPGSKSEIKYIEDPKLSYYEFIEFLSELAAESPKHEYPQKRLLEEFDPENPRRFEGVERTLRAYIAEENAKKIAIALGEENDKDFELDWLFVKPKFRNGAATGKILKSLFEKYRSIRLLASAQFGYEPKNDELLIDRNRVVRLNSLVEYYKKWGFEEDTNAETYKYSEMPGMPMPMIWKK